MPNQRLLLGVPAALLAFCFLAPRAQAIPAFARLHEFSCSTCHNPFPRLKDYGAEFAGNAFAPSDQEMPPRYTTDVGDDRLALLRVLPVALRVDLYADVQASPAASAGAKGDGFADFKTPWGLKLLSGGRLATDIGYYFYFYLSEAGEIAGIEDAYLHFNDLFGTGIDLLIGQFQLSDPLFKRELRLTFEDYRVYKLRPGQSGSDLTYDRGLMLTYDFDFGLAVTASVTNGNGKGEAIAHDYDLDRYKHFGLRLSQDLGPLRVGVFGFYGKEKLPNQESGTLATNELNIWGPDLTLAVDPVELNVQFLQRRDLNPHAGTRYLGEPLLSQGVMAEAIVRLAGDPGHLYGVLLFNFLDSALATIDHESYTANLTYLLRTNIKVLGEYTFARVRDGLEQNEHRFTIGILAGI